MGIRPHDPSHEDRLRRAALGWRLWLEDRAVGGGGHRWRLALSVAARVAEKKAGAASAFLGIVPPPGSSI